ncbi:MAG: hypothetical protein AAGF47_05130 [Planctomycetota bacterium]
MNRTTMASASILLLASGPTLGQFQSVSPIKPDSMPDNTGAWVLSADGTHWQSDNGCGTILQTPNVTRGFDRDPRPIMTIQFSEPSPDRRTLENPTGIYWHRERAGIQLVVDTLDRMYDKGWRRIQLRYPGGQIALAPTTPDDPPNPRHPVEVVTGIPSVPGGLVTMAQWWFLHQDERDAFTLAVSYWIQEHPDVEMTLYLGRTSAEPWNPCSGSWVVTLPDITDPTSTDCYNCLGTEYAPSDPSNAEFMRRTYSNLQPFWNIGFSGATFDNYSGSTNGFFPDFRNSPDFDGTTFLAAEAFVTDGAVPPDTTIINDVEANKYPMMAYTNFVTNPNFGQIIDPQTGALNYPAPRGSATGDPTTEIHINIQWRNGINTNAWSINNIAEYPTQYYTPGGHYTAWSATLAEPNHNLMIRKIYDFPIDSLTDCERGDVNGDGQLNIADGDLLTLIMVGAVVRPPNPGPWAATGDFNDGLGIYHGDINDDGVVDFDDWTAWSSLVCP